MQVLSVITAVAIIYLIFAAASACMAYAWKTIKAVLWKSEERKNEEDLACIISRSHGDRRNSVYTRAAAGHSNGEGRNGANSTRHCP